MIYIPIFIFSCLLFILWFLTVIYKLITSKISDNFYEREDSDIRLKANHIDFLIIVFASMLFITIKFFNDNVLFSTFILSVLSILIVLFFIFFYHNHYLTTGKIVKEKIEKYKKIRIFSAAILTVVLMILCTVSYIFAFE